MAENFVTEKSSNTTWYRLIIIVEAIVIAVLLWLLFTSKQLVTEAVEQKEDLRVELTTELDSLMKEHDLIKQEYGDLALQMTAKDSMILAQSLEIKKLISKNADYAQVKKKLDYLRSITQSYVDQIDSLFTVNAQLKQEIVGYKQDIESEKQKTNNLEQEKSELTNIINVAAGDLKAYNISGKTFHLKGKAEKEVETMKASRVDRVRICFTIGQNLVAASGKRNVYVRISRPDKMIIAQGQGDEFSFEANGARLQYSLKKEVDYQNKSMDVCMSWDKRTASPAMEGTYYVSIFMDGKEIGQTSFVLE